MQSGVLSTLAQICSLLLHLTFSVQGSTHKAALSLPGHGAHLALLCMLYEDKTLCMLFGVFPPPRTLSRTLRKDEEALSQTLNGYAPARIS
ncbi:hypothetical protein KRP22_007236 [Phytophthora ramorum]